MEPIYTDVLVIGAGAAGLCSAISAKERGVSVLVVSTSAPGTGNATAVAGGLINVALSHGDSPAQHSADTLRAGAGLCDRVKVEHMTEVMPTLIHTLEHYGVQIAHNSDGSIFQFQSPGHSCARTLLVNPRHGTSLSRPLVTYAQKIGVQFIHPLSIVRLYKHDGMVTGALGYNLNTNSFVSIFATSVVLATGGSGLLYNLNGIPSFCLGNGISLALSAGCTVADMEFVQFFPTVLNEPGAPPRIIDYGETLRAGARLLNYAGEDIIAKYNLPDPQSITRGELSTVLGRELLSIESEKAFFWFDLENYTPPPTTFPGAFIRWVRPLLSAGMKRIRVSQSCHFFMGGVLSDLDGETGIPGLLACGEVTAGVHGANRLQGNALQEAIVFGFRTGRKAAQNNKESISHSNQLPLTTDLRQEIQSLSTGETNISDTLHALRGIMTKHVGVARENEGLAKSLEFITGLRSKSNLANSRKDHMYTYALTGLLDMAWCIAVGAKMRDESRGIHFRADYLRESKKPTYKWFISLMALR